MKKTQIQLWQDVYRLAAKIRELEPWAYFEESDTFALIRKELELSFFINVLGQSGNRRGIVCYVGVDNYLAARDRLTRPNTKQEPVFLLRNALICLWGDREDVTKENYELIKSLGLKFRGRGAWLRFEQYQIGYASQPLDEAGLLLMKEALENMIMMIRAVLEQRVSVDFARGEILVRQYSPKDKLYYTCTMPANLKQKTEYPTATVSDCEALRDLKVCPSASYSVELDWSYINKSILYEGKPAIPLLVLFVDAASGVILTHNLLSPRHSKTRSLFNCMEDICGKYGKPKELHICDAEIEALIADFCIKTGIKLVVKKRLPKLNAARRSILQYCPASSSIHHKE